MRGIGVEKKNKVSAETAEIRRKDEDKLKIQQQMMNWKWNERKNASGIDRKDL